MRCYVPAAVGLALCLGIGTASAARYEITSISITDLGTLGGQDSVARDINNLGDVAGWSHGKEGRKHAFMHLSGVMADIGWALPGYETEATGINNERHVVGIARALTAPFRPHATIYFFGGSMVLMDEGVDPDIDEVCDYSSAAYAISDGGAVAGGISIASENPLCFPVMEPAYWLSPFGAAEVFEVGIDGGRNFDVNNAGLLAGTANVPGSFVATAAFRWNAGVLTSVPLNPAIVGRISSGAARGVNDAGQLVGEFAVPTSSAAKPRAWLWNGSSASSRDLGLLPTGTLSSAYEINEQGFVVGLADKFTISPVPGPPGYRRNAGFIWHESFGMRELPRLPTSGFSGGCEAYAVNDLRQTSGRVQVAGYCTSGSRRRAVRWDVNTRPLAP